MLGTFQESKNIKECLQDHRTLGNIAKVKEHSTYSDGRSAGDPIRDQITFWNIRHNITEHFNNQQTIRNISRIEDIMEHFERLRTLTSCS